MCETMRSIRLKNKCFIFLTPQDGRQITVLLPTRKCREPLWNIFPQSANHVTISVTNWFAIDILSQPTWAVPAWFSSWYINCFTTGALVFWASNECGSQMQQPKKITHWKNGMKHVHVFHFSGVENTSKFKTHTNNPSNANFHGNSERNLKNFNNPQRKWLEILGA